MNMHIVSERIDPSNSVEVAVDQRIVGLFSANRALDELWRTNDHARLYIRENMEDLEIARDALSSLIDRARGLS